MIHSLSGRAVDQAFDDARVTGVGWLKITPGPGLGGAGASVEVERVEPASVVQKVLLSQDRDRIPIDERAELPWVRITDDPRWRNRWVRVPHDAAGSVWLLCLDCNQQAGLGKPVAIGPGYADYLLPEIDHRPTCPRHSSLEEEMGTWSPVEAFTEPEPQVLVGVDPASDGSMVVCTVLRTDEGYQVLDVRHLEPKETK